GVPVVLGKGGVEKVVDLKLNADEQKQLDASASAVKATVENLKAMNL
ncbi:MAG: malate dehydrogenase, partial [Paludibacteraceae bacterium]|nr:malate dehydrogenase [Paludibacteraceae bacterium]